MLGGVNNGGDDGAMIYANGSDMVIEDGGDIQFANQEEYQRMLMENGVVVDVGEIEFDENEYGEYGFEE
jgi:hypothetical protein